MKELLERYINVALDNGYKDLFLGKFKIYDSVDISCTSVIGWIVIAQDHCLYNVIEVITSKEFIEAVVRYDISRCIEAGIPKTANGLIENRTNNITIEQAIAIRDGKLEEFIKQILD